MENINILTIFMTGLLTGGLTCMAVQGGLLAAMLAQSESAFAKVVKVKEKRPRGNAFPIIAFLGSKLLAYTVLGFLLGFLGSFFQLSVQLKVVLQIAVAIFMIGTALNILNVHPLFRYFVIQPPKFLTRLVRKQSKSKDLFAPAILGAFTIFIPCGTTQAMMALAVASGNPLLGATVMFAFILGTSPVFFVLGYFATKLGNMFHANFMRLAAFAIVLLALFNINNAISLTGSNLTFDKIAKGAWCAVSFCGDASPSAHAGSPVTKATITINSDAYEPNAITVKAGSSVTLHLQNKNGASCIQAFTIPQLGIQKVVPVGQSTDLSFTAPKQPGQIRFMCSMGMYSGVINVI